MSGNSYATSPTEALIMREVRASVKVAYSCWQTNPDCPEALIALKNAVDYLHIITLKGTRRKVANCERLRLDDKHNQGDEDDTG